MLSAQGLTARCPPMDTASLSSYNPVSSRITGKPDLKDL